MTIEQAVQALAERLHATPWFTAVGIGEHRGNPCLYVYVTSVRLADLDFLRNGWNGFHVEVRRMSTPRIAADSSVG